MVALLMLRASRPTLLLALSLLFVAGCEPDECDLALAYNIAGIGNHAITWAAPSAECSVSNESVLGGTIEWSLDNAQFRFRSPGVLGIGVHLVTVTYRDSAGKTWYSTAGSGSIPPSTCVATIVEWELVDWVVDDHYRIRGMVTCPGPLLDTDIGDLGSAQRLQFMQDVTFNVYVGKLGY
jgi:hypothetical protein